MPTERIWVQIKLGPTKNEGVKLFWLRHRVVLSKLQIVHGPTLCETFRALLDLCQIVLLFCFLIEGSPLEGLVLVEASI